MKFSQLTKALENYEGKVISTKVSLLDELLSGGWREGTFNIIAGWPGAGKSTMMGNIAGGLGDQGIPVALLDTEHSLTSERLLELGKETDQFFISKPRCLEDVLEVMMDFCRGRFSSKDGKLMSEKWELPESFFSSPAFVLWDSLAGTPLAAELELLTNTLKADSSSAKGHFDRKVIPVGLVAQVFTIALRNLIPQIDQDPRVTLICSNQYRGKLSLDPYAKTPQSLYGERGNMPGGLAVKHAAFHLLELAVKLRDKDGEGAWVEVRVLKNKQGPLNRGKLYMKYKTGFTEASTLFFPALKLSGVLTEAGGWYEFEGKKYRRKELEELFFSNSDALATLKGEILKLYSFQDLLDVGI